MLSPVLITPPVASPVTLEEAKEHLRVDHDDENTLIQGLIGAAVAHIDGYEGILGRAIMPQTWSQEYDGFCGDMVLPFGPVQSVSSVGYDGETFTDYRLLKDGRGPFLRVSTGSSWPSASGPVTVEYVAGADEAPAPIKAAILLHIGTLYEYRETMVENVNLSPAYEALIAPYRVWHG